MKNQLLFLVFISINSCAYSQVTEPLIQPGAVWIYDKFDDFGIPSFSRTVEVENDTTINGNQYYKVGQSLMRTEGNQTYFYRDSDTMEHVMYDFDLVVGDTFVAQLTDDYGNGMDSVLAIVAEINTIQTLDGINRKQFYFQEGTSVIEGIGSTWAIDMPAYQLSVSGTCDLACFSINSTPIFGNNLMGSCLTPVEDIVVGQLNLFPNPTTNLLYLDNLNFQNRMIIYDVTGKVVMEQHDIRNEVFVRDLLNGIYYLVLEIEDGVFVEKFVKGD